MSTVSNDVDEIRQQMALIRRDLHENVREVVATAEAATDWRRYLTMYPWVSLGAAFAVGYVIVPRRRRPPAGVATQADLSQVREAVETTRQTVVDAARGTADEARKHKKGLIGAALGILTPLALRAAQGYALKYLEHWIAHQQTSQAAGAPPHPAAAPGGRGPGPARPADPRRGPGYGMP